MGRVSLRRVGRAGRPGRASLHPDVHLEPADQLLVDQQPVFLLHAAEPTLHGQLEVASVDCGAMPTAATASPKSAATALSSARRRTISFAELLQGTTSSRVFISTVLR